MYLYFNKCESTCTLLKYFQMYFAPCLHTTHTYTCMYAHTHTCMYTPPPTHTHRPTHARTLTHTHKHTHTHVHTYQEYPSELEFSTHITKYSLNHFCHYGSKLLCLYSKDNNGHGNSTSRNTVNLHKAVSVNMMIINTNTLHTIPTYITTLISDQ